MVRKKLGVKSVKDLDGAAVCVNSGTTTELNLADYFRSNNMKYRSVVFEKMDEVVAAYVAGRCDAFTTDASGLAAQRARFKDAYAHVILSEIISKETLAPAARHAHNQWVELTRCTQNNVKSTRRKS